MQKTFTQLLIVVFILFQLPMATAYAEVASASKPNIIFIMADDLGKDLLSVYGAKPVIKTPNIERLAKEGVVFKNSYATPVCFPTRVALVSGRYSLNTGAYLNQFPHGDIIPNKKYLHRVVAGGRTSGFYKYIYKNDASIHPFIDPQHTPSFAMPLKQAGYTTAIVGKWHLNNYVKQQRIFRTYGFDRWMMYDDHRASEATTDKGFVVTPGYIPSKAADFIVDFITENKNKPFFIYYPMNLVHTPYLVPHNAFGRFTHTESERHIAMIEYVDVIIGHIVEALEASNLRDQTIIFFSGDNGAAQEYRRLYELVQTTEDDKTKPFYGKGSLYEGGVNVPLIVSGGPVMQRGETEALVDFTDILPTLADFAGISVTRKNRENDTDYRGIAGLYTSVAELYKVDGYSIAPYLTGQTEDTPRDWIMFAGKQTTVIRDKRFKFWAGSQNRLYDLYNDPYEQVNLYDSNEANILAAKQRLENILNGMPTGSSIDMHFDPVDWNYGMLTHWTMDQSAFPQNTTRLADTEGGYDAESKIDVVVKKQGKLGEAIEENLLYAPYSKGLFYNFMADSNDRFFKKLSGMNIFVRAIGKLIRTNQTLMNITSSIYNAWSGSGELLSRKGDREKFLSSMTVTAWVQTPQLNQNIYLLKQPYIGKEGNLISFSITKDGTISFELATNDEHHKLESGTLDKRLWGEWMHIAATWDGRDDCGKAVLYVNGKSISEGCLGESLSAEDTDNLLLGGFTESSMPNIAKVLVDDIAIWQQPLMPMQIEALYSLGNRFSYNASEVDSLFNTPAKNGTTKISDQVWRRIPLDDTADIDRLIIRELPDAIEVQFGEVMAIRLNENKI